jgi:hypothetical protein
LIHASVAEDFARELTLFALEVAGLARQIDRRRGSRIDVEFLPYNAEID